MIKSASHWTTKDILGTLHAHAPELRQLGALKLGLFGSYRHGTPSANSDMDFLVVLQRPSFDDYMAIKFFLEDLFEHKIDLVLENGLKPRIRDTILNEVLYVEGL
jgi:predicted nucleotidyltransferase